MDIREPGTQKIILVAIACVAILYGFFFTTILPFTFKARAAEVNQAQFEIEDLSADVAKARAAVANLPALERECAEVHQRWEEMSDLLPTSKEIASLLSKVTMAGQESGIHFALFQPGAPREQEFYTVYPVQLRVEGGYHSVGRFLAEVANLDRIVNIVDLNMSAMEPDKQNPERTIVASFTAETYAFKEVARNPNQGMAKEEGK